MTNNPPYPGNNKHNAMKKSETEKSTMKLN